MSYIKNENIRNFVIIAHIDAGKSTLSDRFLEITKTVSPRDMHPQYLDMMELERERGITIKMAPVRMNYNVGGADYVLNLIDTPGHSDFSYEVSRALAAVEGAILLVDATKGIQAQTLANLRAAKKAGIKIIGAVNKIDIAGSRVTEVIRSTAKLLSVKEDDIFRISAKNGDGVANLLNAVIEKMPPPKILGGRTKNGLFRALIFDSLYNEHKGVIAYVRVFNGSVSAGDKIGFLAGRSECKVKEVGFFSPQLAPEQSIMSGGVGYIATGIKQPSLIKIGDTVIGGESILREGIEKNRIFALPGYREPMPVMFVSVYPDGNTKYDDLKSALDKLSLNDSAISFTADTNEALGRGFRIGFLGRLHFEIVVSRLREEFSLEILTSFPSVVYKIRSGSRVFIVRDANDFPDDFDEVFEKIIKLEILIPDEYLNCVSGLKSIFDIDIKKVDSLGEQTIVSCEMPIRELVYDFDDKLKSMSSGYASFSYEVDGERRANVAKLEILVEGKIVPALTRIVSKKDIEKEARKTVKDLKRLLKRKQFKQAVQARACGRIIAREDIPAISKDVAGYLYGGDRSRKMKLWKKQKKGKKKLKQISKVDVPVEVFREILKK